MWFIEGLESDRLDSLLKRLNIHVLSNIRLKETFYLPMGQTNFSRNPLLASMMQDYNNSM